MKVLKLKAENYRDQFFKRNWENIGLFLGCNVAFDPLHLKIVSRPATWRLFPKGPFFVFLFIYFFFF